MATIIDGKAVANKVLEELKEEVDKLKQRNITPTLAVILVGDDPSSKVYVKNKSKACEKTGVEFKEYLLPSETTEEELLSLINTLNDEENIDGILLQSPVPEHLNIAKAFSTIKPEKDVDGFNPINAGMLSMGYPVFVPCTPLGVVRLLTEYNIDVEGKNVTMIGRSNIVGKPMTQILINKSATVTVCHSKTKDLKAETLRADVLITAIGKAKMITADMVKPDAVVIDIGISRNEDGKLSGDVDFSNVQDIASYITPVPGGVGPMTIAMLMNNVILSCKNRRK